ncbi:hypothetical protein ALC57_12865 [Trachymyrmex cornetzi]|uniref:THAP domain-containing protein 9 n=1 Tax=Trachymyrmex cornetzi TaxID=471704 RepID=A0A151J094_9HYME|nr:hypothetical protein ALC57_12865 [Trachymyrmex cornetzi]
MKVQTAKDVINNKTRTGLKLLAEYKHDPTYLTTAWFVDFSNHFFDIITSRNYKMALSKYNTDVYLSTLDHIRKFEHIIHNMSVGKGAWKPCKTGIRILCSSVVNLQEYYLNKVGYSFLLLGRFTQDSVENLFSCIRLAQPLPNIIAFKQNFKVITISKNGFIIYDMVGAVLRSVKKSYKSCETCINSVLWHENKSHPFNLVVQLKNYTPGALVEVSHDCFKAIMKCEITFRKIRFVLLNAKNIDIVQCFTEGMLYIWEGNNIPDCHKITRKILYRFIRMRSRLYGLKQRENIAALFSKQSKLTSKSIAMRESIKNKEIKRSSFISQ